MAKAGVENKCTNCALKFKCNDYTGVVVWKRCPNFRPSKEAVAKVQTNTKKKIYRCYY